MLLLLKAVFALAATLGLFGMGVYIARRWGPAGLFKLKPAEARRMAVVESLPLDASHRLMLVRVDGTERLVLLGEGQIASEVAEITP
jgi:flagellar protein FliO/FliZ